MQKALIIDDERLARNELKKLLLEFPEIEVIGEAANAANDAVLTAPEGNAWLMRGLAKRASGRIVTGAMVWRIEEGKANVVVDAVVDGKTVRFEARQLIWAAPAFVLPHVWPAIPGELKAAAQAGDYAPWLTANLHLADFPEERHGAPPAWDNVFYDSPGLGYVVATRLDIFRNGHAMRRPVPGSIWYGQRQKLADFRSRRITLAHADLSGFSLFEEAQYRGVLAAQRVMSALGTNLVHRL